MNKKIRYPFKKVCFWLLLLNVFFAVITLVILFNVRVPYQSLDMREFSVSRYLIRIGVSAVFQIVFYYFALNRYYRLLARKASWKEYLLPTLALMAGCFIYYFLYDVTTKKEEFKIAIDISMKDLYLRLVIAIFQLIIPFVIRRDHPAAG